MHALLGALASVLLVVALASAADDKTARPTSTQRTTECNARAGEKHLSGDARRQFVADCLKTKPEVTSGPEAKRHTTQGDKMKACNQDASAKNLHGDERKSFMSACLKGEKKS